MRAVYILTMSFGSIFVLCQICGHGTAGAQELTRIAPTSGGVDLNEIRIVRQANLGAVKDADLTNMELEFCFLATWNMKGNQAAHLVRLQTLDAIEDDTGSVLSPEKRLKQIDCFRNDARGSQWHNSGDKEGPIIRITLDAPARGAAKIKALKGKARVTTAKAVNLTFNDLSAISGKILEHKNMKALSALRLQFSVEEKDGQLSVKVAAPVNFASPWNRGLLQDWAVVDGEQVLNLTSEGVKPDGDGVIVERTYRRGTFKGLSLRLVVLEPLESKDFDFHFQNVPLP